MPENYRAIYVHPGGATATFVRQDGELDALAKGLDAEQFWVFKNVKALLVRNEVGDLEEANRLMASIGFTPTIHIITTPQPMPEMAELAGVAAEPEVAHSGVHLPNPSYWPLALGISALIAFVGLLMVESTFVVSAVGVIAAFISIIGWGLEPAA